MRPATEIEADMGYWLHVAMGLSFGLASEYKLLAFMAAIAHFSMAYEANRLESQRLSAWPVAGANAA